MEFIPWLATQKKRTDEVGDLAVDLPSQLYCPSVHRGNPPLYTPQTLGQAIREWLREPVDCTGCGEPHPRMALLAGDGSFIGWCIECDTFEKAAP